MPEVSAGILLYRQRDQGLEVLLVHPGGFFNRNRDLGAWGIPKGHVNDGEDTLLAAQREFSEETGHQVSAPFHPLGTVRLKSGKIVHAWAAMGDLNAAQCKSNLCKVQTKSGRWVTIPEVDRAEWFTLEVAREKIHAGQVALLERLVEAVG